MFSRNRTFFIACSLVLGAWTSASSGALLTWNDPATDNWFDATNWDPGGAIPTSADTARIVNGGTATAAADIAALSLNVGSTSDPTAASGNLEVTSGNVALGGSLNVGNTLGGAAVGTSAVGSLAVGGAISGASDAFFLGSNLGAGSNAEGTISASSYTGANTFFAVGRDAVFDVAGGGSGTGSMTLSGDLDLTQKVSFFEVGFTFSNGEKADGLFSAAGGDVLAGHVVIGAHDGSTTAAGDVRGIADLGSGSLSSDQDGLLAVGRLLTGRSGTAVGELSLNGVSGYGQQLVGVAGGGSTGGSAEGTLTVGSGGIVGGSLAIGTAGNGTADATGLVEVNGGNLALSSDLNVGTNSGTANSTVDGTLRIVDGDLNVGGLVSVGLVSGVASSKQATARLEVSNGNLSTGLVRVGNAIGAGSTDASATFDRVTGQIEALQIGESFNPAGNPNGRVELTQSVLDVEGFVAVGFGLGGGTGNGALTLTDSILNVGVGLDTATLFGRVFVGAVPGDVAELSLQRSLVDAARALTMGDGARLGIAVGGGVRVDEYAAIDAQSVLLGGELFIDIDFTPMLDSMVFDLIVSESIDGINGDFSHVDISGLAIGYSATTGIELVDFGGGDVEVYRLRISRNAETVPAPGTVWLLLVPMIGMRLFSARRCSVNDSSTHWPA